MSALWFTNTFAPVGRQDEFSRPDPTAGSFGPRLMRDIIPAVLRSGHRMAFFDQPGIQIEIALKATPDDPPIAVAPCLFAAHRTALCPVLQRKGRRLPATPLYAAFPAALRGFRGINGMQPDALLMNVDGISVDDRRNPLQARGLWLESVWQVFLQFLSGTALQALEGLIEIFGQFQVGQGEKQPRHPDCGRPDKWSRPKAAVQMTFKLLHASA